MAVGRNRGSRRAGGKSAAVRDEDGQSAGASVDGLLARVAHGDAEAFAAVYDQVADEVHGLMSRIVGDRSRAEQLTADALVEVWRSASLFRPAESSGPRDPRRAAPRTLAGGWATAREAGLSWRPCTSTLAPASCRAARSGA
jgi:Sigma-70 region 2